MHLRTPLIESAALSAVSGRPVFLKMESAQPTGSFKIRGIGRLCSSLKSRGATHLVSSSGGNAGCAAAWCGRRLGLRVTVVVPSTTPAWMCRRIEREGADVVVHGEVWDQAHARAMALAEADPEVGLVPPFDDPLIWAGNSTLIEEAAELMDPPGAVIASVGGGGLLAGVLLGMEAVGWGSVPVLAVETEGAASFAAAMREGAPVDIGAIRSIARSLGARQVSQGALSLAISHKGVTPWSVTDADALSACKRFLDDHRALVEPACGASLAAVYNKAAPLQQAASVLVVVCGGQVVTMSQLRAWDELLG